MTEHGPAVGDTTTPIDDYLRPLRSHRRVILLVALVSLGFGVVAALAAPKRYTATAGILLYPVSADPTSALESTERTADLATEARIATSRPVIDGSLERLAEESVVIGAGTFDANLRASTSDDSRVLDLSYSASDAGVAALGARAAAESYLAYRTELTETSRQSAVDAVSARITVLQEQLAEVEARLSRAAEGSSNQVLFSVEKASVEAQVEAQQEALASLSTLQVGGTTVIDPPEAPGGPDGLTGLQTIAGAGIGGIVLGIVVAYLLAAYGSGTPGGGGRRPRRRRDVPAPGRTDDDGSGPAGIPGAETAESAADGDLLQRLNDPSPSTPGAPADPTPEPAASTEPTVATATTVTTSGSATEPTGTDAGPTSEAAAPTAAAPAPTTTTTTTTAATATAAAPAPAAQAIAAPTPGSGSTAAPVPTGARATTPIDPQRSPRPLGEVDPVASQPIPAPTPIPAPASAPSVATPTTGPTAAPSTTVEAPAPTASPVPTGPSASAPGTVPGSAPVPPDEGPSSWDDVESAPSGVEPASTDPTTSTTPTTSAGPTTPTAATEPASSAMPTATTTTTTTTPPAPSPEVPPALAAPAPASSSPSTGSLVATDDLSNLLDQLRHLGAVGPVVALSVAEDDPGAALAVGFDLADELQALGARVLLLDIQIEQPMIDRLLGVPTSPGLAEVLVGKVSLRESVHSLPGLDGLDALTVGAVDGLTASAVTGPAFERLLAQAKIDYHSVVIVAGTADAPLVPALAALVDGIIVGTDQGPGVGLDAAVEARLAALPAPTLELISSALAPGPEPVGAAAAGR